MGLNFALLHLPPKRLEDSVFQAERGEKKTRPAERKKKEREKEKERKEERENIIV
jgi:hypothetical protein